ncbi:MAG TPA: nucleotidyltransferase domain-containing protein [Anaerolineae bacterium]|nr:nucleotidyltransferase domain-containing protein [Anaerolineae bacterium]
MIDIEKQIAFWRDGGVVNVIQQYLYACKNQGLKICFGVVFGSQAQGSAQAWSDIDLIVVSPQFDSGRSQSDLDMLWETAALIDSRIEPIACGEWQWEHDDTSTIIEVARREGIRIDLPKEMPTPTITESKNIT